MDNFTSLTIKQTSNNYHSLKCKNKNIKFTVKNILCPFGIDDEYGNSVIKFELDQYNDKHIDIIKEIKEFEEKIKDQFGASDNEWKSLIHVRDNNNIFIECKIKKIKNTLLTKLTFEEKDKNYLKTIYELGNNFHSDIVIEIPTLWDFRKKLESEELNNNKIGLILNLFSIHVYE